MSKSVDVCVAWLLYKCEGSLHEFSAFLFVFVVLIGTTQSDLNTNGNNITISSWNHDLNLQDLL